MRPAPRSRFVDEKGRIDWQSIGEVPEYPERVAWDKEFEGECDRLAELDALKTGKRHWGRWYLTKPSLVTKTIRPEIDRQKPLYVGVYEIGLDRIGDNPYGRSWVKHMAEKNWIGEKGLKDLAKAIKSLRNSRRPLSAH